MLKQVPGWLWGEVPWIFEGTLRENIITKSALHQERVTLSWYAGIFAAMLWPRCMWMMWMNVPMCTQKWTTCSRMYETWLEPNKVILKMFSSITFNYCSKNMIPLNVTTRSNKKWTQGTSSNLPTGDIDMRVAPLPRLLQLYLRCRPSTRSSNSPWRRSGGQLRCRVVLVEQWWNAPKNVTMKVEVHF